MIPDKLTADYSENYKVSIRLMPDGFSFFGYVPAEKDSFFMEKFLFNKEQPIVDALKNSIFTNPCFSYAYQSFHVICVSEKYTMAADHVFVEQEKDRLFAYCHQKAKSLKVFAQPIKALNTFILFGIDNEVYAFLVRSLANPVFVHSLSPLLLAWHKKSLTVSSKLMHVVIHESTMDILCVEQGDLLFLNSYDFDNDNDILYYIMYICKQTGFNQLEDHLTMNGNQSRCRSALSIVNKYIKRVDYIQPALEGYMVALNEELPLDVIALIECGL